MGSNTHKLPNGKEILLGQDIYGTWVITCWDIEFNIVWTQEFDKQSEAERVFEQLKNGQTTKSVLANQR